MMNENISLITRLRRFRHSFKCLIKTYFYIKALLILSKMPYLSLRAHRSVQVKVESKEDSGDSQFML
jgi:hypothetical protein